MARSPISVHLLVNSRVGSIIRNHGLDNISFCLGKVSSLIGRKPFLFRCIKLGKVIYILGNNEVPPKGPQSKANRFPLRAEIVLTILLLSQKKADDNSFLWMPDWQFIFLRFRVSNDRSGAEVNTGPALANAPITKSSDEMSSDNDAASSNSKEGAASSTSSAAQGDK